MMLQESGLKVLVVEKRPSVGQQDNKCAIGGIRATHANDSKILSCKRSLEIFSTWKDKHGFNIEWQRNGYLFPVYREVDEKTLRSFLPIQRKYGLKIDWIDPQSVSEIVPGIDREGMLGGIYSPNDGSASPMLSSLGFYKHATELGAEFHFHEKITRYLMDGNKKITGVETDKGRYSAGIVIDCLGADSGPLGKTPRNP